MSFLSKADRRPTRWARGQGHTDPADGFFFDDVHPEDTYLVSFPRSGNTFLRHLVASLVLDRAPTSDEVQDVVPDVHRSATRARPSRPGPVIAKSHAPARPLPAKVVYLVRDGRDALLSYYGYLQRRGRPTPSHLDDMLAWSGVWPCPWADHVSGWLRQLEGRQASLVIRYEDLVAEPTVALREVAALAGISCTDDGLERAVRHSSVEAMQRAERSGTPGSLNFVAAGRSGALRQAFGSTALERFEAICGPILAGLGYDLGASDHV